ncbi:MAG: hypothetical protein H6510_16610 [Acidobacteria bacterium]|nr:hypothetical protein [Acidobacteriota bacterium]MCB9399437.1 hypothetical protein [Acidobacteriota bacterium]
MWFALVLGLKPQAKDTPTLRVSHPKEWIWLRLKALAGVFAAAVCDYAVMSNHLPVILGNRPDWVESWSNEEESTRWRLLFPLRRAPLTGATIEPALLSHPKTRAASIRNDFWRIARSVAEQRMPKHFKGYLSTWPERFSVLGQHIKTF